MSNLSDVNLLQGPSWTYVLKKDEEGDYVIRVKEFPELVAHGSSPTRAVLIILELVAACITEYKVQGKEIPEPSYDY
jgi:hypothetical protein